MNEEEKLSEQESLALITSMIQKAKSSYYERGTGSLLWGSAVSIASFVTFLQWHYQFYIGFDIWLILLAAFIPQAFISAKEKKEKQFRSHSDVAVDAVWLVFAVTIFGLTAYQLITPAVSVTLSAREGWVMMKHFTDGVKPDEPLTPFPPSFYSIFILIYAMPTLITGIIKKFRPMIIGAFIGYACFIISCFAPSEIDMLLGTLTALTCWFIPGVILRKRYNLQKNAKHV